MGYDFERDDAANWGTTSIGWHLLQHLAERFGWRPAGTLAPDDWDDGRIWHGEYTGNSGQRVTAADAAALATALRAAVVSSEFDGQVSAFGAEFRGSLAAASTPIVILISKPFSPDEWRSATLEFACFCEGGGFSIH